MIRIVLDATVTQDDLDDAAFEEGLLLLNIVPATTEYPSQIIFMTPDRQNLIHVIDDARLDTFHLVVNGPGEEACAAALRARLPARIEPASSTEATSRSQAS